MSEPMFAWTAGGAAVRLRWRGPDGTWTNGSCEEFARALTGRSAVVLVDGAAVTILETSLPARDLRTARRALPYAIEDALAEPLDELHFTLEYLGGGRYAVAVMRADLRAALGAALAAAGVTPRLVTTEYDALPVVPGGCSIHLVDDMAVVRLAGYAGIKLRSADLAALPGLVRDGCAPGAGVRVYGASAAPPDWPAAAFASLEIEWRARLTDAELCAALAATPPLALVEPASEHARRGRARRLWQAVAAVVLVMTLAYPAALAWRNASLARAVAEQGAANRVTFAAAFPHVTRVVNPRVQADQALAELRARAVRPARFLELVSALDVLDALGDAKLPAGTRVARAAFADGALELGIETTGMGAVEQFRTTLEAHGLVADLLSAESDHDKVIARLRVGPG